MLNWLNKIFQKPEIVEEEFVIPDNVTKTDVGYLLNYEGIDCIIDYEEIDKPLITYATNLAKFYLEKKDIIDDYLYTKLSEQGYNYALSKEELISKIGNPLVNVLDIISGQLIYKNTSLDSISITIDVDFYKFDMDDAKTLSTLEKHAKVNIQKN